MSLIFFSFLLYSSLQDSRICRNQFSTPYLRMVIQLGKYLLSLVEKLKEKLASGFAQLFFNSVFCSIVGRKYLTEMKIEHTQKFQVKQLYTLFSKCNSETMKSMDFNLNSYICSTKLILESTQVRQEISFFNKFSLSFTFHEVMCLQKLVLHKKDFSPAGN